MKSDPAKIKSSEGVEKYSAPALEKGLDILELLSQQDVPLSMPEIAKRLGRSRSEIFRMALTLERRGYLSRPGGKDEFEVTSRLFALAMSRPPVRNLTEVAVPFMRELSSVLDQSCHLAVAARAFMLVTANVEAPGNIGFSVRTGHRQRLSRSASGRILFAFQPEAVRTLWVKWLTEQEEEFAGELPQFERKIKKIREFGYELSPSRKVVGVTDISAPIYSIMSEGAIASLTVPFVAHVAVQNEQEEAILLVVRAAKNISAELGYDVVDSA